MNLKNIIISYFNRIDVVHDINKDGNGKGTLERFNEVVAEEYDIFTEPLLVNLLDNVHNSLICSEDYLLYLQSSSGNNNLLLDFDLSTKRLVQKYLRSFYKIKGTKKCFEALYNLIGFSVIITEHVSVYSLDHDTFTFDDDNRTFDQSCSGCSEFSLDLTRHSGVLPITDSELQAIYSIVLFNTPINAQLREVTFNGGTVSSGDFDLNDFNNDFN